MSSRVLMMQIAQAQDFSSWYLGYVAATWAIRLVMIPVIVVRQPRPTTALAWLVLVLLLPELALPAYVLFGDARLGNRRARRYAAHAGLPSSSPARVRLLQNILDPDLSPPQEQVSLVAERLGASPVRGGNSVELLSDAAAFERRLIEDIDHATNHIHLLYYIFQDDDVGARIVAALEQAAKRGVKVRVLADAAGSWAFFRRLAPRLIAAGADVRDHLPVNPLRRRLLRFDLRNHRKLAVIDGTIAYTGSHNLVNPHVGLSRRMIKRGAAWMDVTARVRGPAVALLALVFMDDWHFETDEDLSDATYLLSQEVQGPAAVQVIASGPHMHEAMVRDVMIEALHRARSRAIITTPYFVPDESMLTAMRLAALRGVTVDLVVPYRSDNRTCDIVARSFFELLMRDGVRIYRHTKGVLHSKTISIDDTIAMIGSANIDMRSFFLNFELGILVYDAEAVSQVRYCQSEYINDATRVDYDRLTRRPLSRRLSEGLARLLAPLL